MFCKHCGAHVQSDMNRCPQCGGKISLNACAKIAPFRRKRCSIPYMLILILGILPSIVSLVEIIYRIFSWLEVQDEIYNLEMKLHLDRWLQVELIPSILCLSVLICCAVFALIDTDKFKYSDVVIILMILFFSDDATSYVDKFLVQMVSDNWYMGFNIFDLIYSVVALPVAWRWYLVAVYVFVRCECVRNYKIFLGINLAVLVLWSASLYIMNPSLIKGYTHDSIIYRITYEFSRISYLELWLIRFIQLLVICLVGRRIIKTGKMIICTIMKIILSVISKYLLIFKCHFGPTSLPISRGLAYFVVGCIACLAFVRYKRKRRAVT